MRLLDKTAHNVEIISELADNTQKEPDEKSKQPSTNDAQNCKKIDGKVEISYTLDMTVLMIQRHAK